MFRPLARTALTIAVLASAVACSSDDTGGEGYTLRIGATSPTGTPAGSLGWGDKEGILTEELKAAGVDKIEYSFFQSGSDAASALIAGAVDVAAIGDNPALRARSRDPKVVLLALDSINGDAWLVGAKGGPTDIAGLVGKNVTAPAGHHPGSRRQAADRGGRPQRQDPGARRADPRIHRGAQFRTDRRDRGDRRQRDRTAGEGLPDHRQPLQARLRQHRDQHRADVVHRSAPRFRTGLAEGNHRGQPQHHRELRRLHGVDRQDRRHQRRQRAEVDQHRRVQHRTVPQAGCRTA